MNPTARAWKDPVFRAMLDDSHRDVMADSPVGAVAGPDVGLADIFGGDHRPWSFHTCFTCNSCRITCRSFCFCSFAV